MYRMVGNLNEVVMIILEAINSGKKVNIHENRLVEGKLRILCALWNFAVDQGFADSEKVDIATELLRTLTKTAE